jgi:hypothetical protein
MTAAPSNPSNPPPSAGHHLATISHEGRFWDVYLEFEDDPRRPANFRALLCFFPGDPGGDEEASRTTVIIIEESFEEAMVKARGLDDRHLQGLLRSVLPG